MNKKGFTLIELLIVITILGILAGLILASYGAAQARSRDARRKTDLDALKKALQLVKQDTPGQYYFPACDSGSSCNISDNNTTTDLAPTYIKTVPRDPKSNTGYLYTPSGCTGANCTDYTLTACLENINDTQKDATDTCPASDTVSFTITSN
jgi:general secretion pathway protein G